jgi:hypothetical protein
VRKGHATPAAGATRAAKASHFRCQPAGPQAPRGEFAESGGPAKPGRLQRSCQAAIPQDVLKVGTAVQMPHLTEHSAKIAKVRPGGWSITGASEERGRDDSISVYFGSGVRTKGGPRQADRCGPEEIFPGGETVRRRPTSLPGLCFFLIPWIQTTEARVRPLAAGRARRVITWAASSKLNCSSTWPSTKATLFIP